MSKTVVYVVTNQAHMSARSDVVGVYSDRELAKIVAKQTSGRSDIWSYVLDETSEDRKERRRKMAEEIRAKTKEIEEKYGYTRGG